MARSLRRRSVLSSFTVLALAGLGCSRVTPAADVKLAPLLPPADLAARLSDIKAGKIAVLHIGPKLLFQRERIPGSRWVGETGTSEGLAALEAAVNAIPAEVEVVAYCGCCPVANCPNVFPARQALGKRARATVLDLPSNFRTDWAKKGYAIEQG